MNMHIDKAQPIVLVPGRVFQTPGGDFETWWPEVWNANSTTIISKISHDTKTWFKSFVTICTNIFRI